MHVVMGATGHVGAAVANALLDRGEAVTICTRHPEGAQAWRARGASVAFADAEDVGSLKAAFQCGRRAFLLNPPADPSGDTDAAELHTIANILAALEGSGLEKVVAASTYGARPGNAIGDLSTLWAFEKGLRSQAIPAAINRGAYYMTNWTGLTDAVRRSRQLATMYPASTLMPMVAPLDLGEAAASRLLGPVDDQVLWHVEGPERYTPQDVADAFARALGRQVTLDVAPRHQWKTVYKSLGFSDAAAHAYVRMTELSLDNDFDKPERPVRGSVTLQDFLAAASNK